MADLDDLRRLQFRFGVTSTNNSFHVKERNIFRGDEGSFITYLQSEDRQNRDAGI